MITYKIEDLTEEYVDSFCLCLEDWSDEIRESGSHKRDWYEKMQDKGLGVKIAFNENGDLGGMIQYYPVEYSPAVGENCFFIQCVWVHGYKQGRGNFQKKGMGTALLAAAEEDVRSRGVHGVACWGVSLPFWMKASWFKKHGYRPVDNDKGAVLLWKQFTEDAKPPMWRRMEKTIPSHDAGGTPLIVGFINGVCPAMSLVYERARRAAGEIGPPVKFRSIDTSTPEALREWGTAHGVFVAGKELRSGPPPSYKKVLKTIRKLT